MVLVFFQSDRNADLRFEQGATTSDYGARASQDLIVTRGAGFRKEKNKKKRGSYRGGDITVRCRNYHILVSYLLL